MSTVLTFGKTIQGTRSGWGVEVRRELCSNLVYQPGLMELGRRRTVPYVRRSARVAAALPWRYLNRDLQWGPGRGPGGAWGGHQGPLSGRLGAAEGAAERGVPGVDASRPGRQTVSLLMGRWHLHAPAGNRRSAPVLAGHHQCDRRRYPKSAWPSTTGCASLPPPGWTSCATPRNGASRAVPAWRLGMAPWVFGPPWMRSTRTAFISAAGSTRWAMCSRRCPSACRSSARPIRRRSGWRPAGRRRLRPGGGFAPREGRRTTRRHTLQRRGSCV